jgi:hypothetical protein
MNANRPLSVEVAVRSMDDVVHSLVAVPAQQVNRGVMNNMIVAAASSSRCFFAGDRLATGPSPQPSP